MNRWLRFALISAVVFAAGYVALMWVAVGGLEQFQPQFEIVIPETVHGVVCATSRPGTTEDIKHVVRHEVTTDGLLLVNGDILRSHRPITLLVRSTSTEKLSEIPSNTLLPIYTENDTASGQWYAVMWLGSADEWNAYRERSPNATRCLGRFEKVAVK